MNQVVAQFRVNYTYGPEDKKENNKIEPVTMTTSIKYPV